MLEMAANAITIKEIKVQVFSLPYYPYRHSNFFFGTLFQISGFIQQMMPYTSLTKEIRCNVLNCNYYQ